MAANRRRRQPEEARRVILDAAARLLAEGGVTAVEVRAVAAQLGMTDAGVSHHFGSRDNLLHELLRHGGRRLRRGLEATIETWFENGANLDELVECLADFYRDGYGELAVSLHAAGWRDHGSGMLDPLVEALHDLRSPGAAIAETRLAVAALHQAIALEPLYGAAFRRSAGFTASQASENTAAQLRWWSRQLVLALELDME